VKPPRTVLILAALLPFLGGCTFVSKSDEYNGLPGQRGKPVAYYGGTNLGINLLFFIPIIGDTSTTAVLREVTKKVKEDGGKNFRVVQSSAAVFWFLFPPITFIIHPAIGYVAGDAEFDGPVGPVKKDGEGADPKAPAGKETAAAAKAGSPAEPKPQDEPDGW
jgi:hypothetical protein